jgi:formamidopyrimidine-DNA glycosylase
MHSEPAGKHEHLVFTFTDGTTLRYHDTRKFGTMEIVPKGTEMTIPAIAEMGPETSSPTFSSRYLARVGGRSSRPVKSLLLDQKIVSGLGNIYVDETLARAGVHPATQARHLVPQEWDSVVVAARAVIDEAIVQGGTTIRSYVSSLGVSGRFQTELMVHARAGLPCRKCGTPIVKTVVGGRGTYYCPSCQEVKTGKGFVIGLTGGIASGKTAVERLFLKAGIPVSDADRVYKDLSKKGKVLYNEIVHEFGERILRADGEIDFRALGGIVFADPAARSRLNAIAHPRVRESLLSWIADRRREGADDIVVSVPLLFEAGFESFCDATIAVWCSPRIQIERLVARDAISRQEALKRVGAQTPLKLKCARADHVIDNSGTRKELRSEFESVLRLLRS